MKINLATEILTIKQKDKKQENNKLAVISLELIRQRRL